MEKKWVESNSVFLDCVEIRFVKSTKASIEVGELVITDIDDNVLTKFETEEAMKEHVAKLKHYEQDRCT